MTVVAELGQVSRFESARRLMGYSGTVPSVNSSGKRQQRGTVALETFAESLRGPRSRCARRAMASRMNCWLSASQLAARGIGTMKLRRVSPTRFSALP